jgi:pimeloyl-ACP methyl ester carboxylesterase
MANACASLPSLAPDLALLNRSFPERSVAAGAGMVSFRECGQGPAIVLLHGIGSGAASWLHCALRLAQGARVVAWNAPGYGDSTPLALAAPEAGDYAARLHGLLEALGLRDVLLVGHSLGALMAAAYAALPESRARGLLLLSPAQGYGGAERRERGRQVLRERLGMLAELGVDGMARQRSSNLLSAAAGDADRAWVRWNMQRLNLAGYSQAVQMLCGDAIEAYLPARVPTLVACGAADAITTPQDSALLAARFGLPYQAIPDAGHACYIERPDALAALIGAQARAATSQQHRDQS